MSYSNTFDVPFRFDDVFYVAENSIIKDSGYFLDPSMADGSVPGADLPHYFRMRYVGYLSFFLNYMLGGLDVRGYHAFNLAVHVLNALLVYGIVLLGFETPRLKASRSGKDAAGVSFLCGLLFAVHPVQTQAVTYISQRFASLSALFYLLALFLYIKSRLSARGGFSPRALVLYLGCLASALAAMKTKETAFTLPVVVLLYEWLFLEGGAGRRLLYLSPLVLTMAVVPLSVADLRLPPGEALAGATRTQLEISRGTYLVTEFRVLATYARLLLLPINQNLDYDYPLYDDLLSPPVVLSFLLLAAAVSSVVFLLVRFRRGADGSYGLMVFWGLWFFVTLSVESSVIALDDVIFEHRLYLPGMGAAIIFGAGAFLLYVRLGGRASRTVFMLVLALVPILFSAATYARNGVWKDDTAFWSDVVGKSPEKARGYNALGLSYWKKGMPGVAVEHFRTTSKYTPIIRRPTITGGRLIWI